MKVANFCLGANGSLVPFDMGSFVLGQAIDIALANHRIRRSLDLDELAAGYRENGGNPSNLDAPRYLKLLGAAGMISYFHDSIKRFPAIQFKRQYYRRCMVEEHLENLGIDLGFEDVESDGLAGLGTAAGAFHQTVRTVARKLKKSPTTKLGT